MRRLICILILLILLAALPVRAEGALPYGADTVLSVQGLTENQQELVHWLYPAILRGEEKIELPKNTRYDDMERVMTALMVDYPELFHLDKTYSLSYYRLKPEIATHVTPAYRMDGETAERFRTQLLDAARDMLNGATSLEEVHDALVARVTYGGDESTCHTAVGAILIGEATCEGYAQAISLLYRMAGYPCGVVTGDAVDAQGVTGRHAWNIADLQGYTLIDATWNDQDDLGMNTHWYYGLSTAQSAATHMPDAGLSVPECTDTYNWHRVRGLYVTEMGQAYEALRAFASGAETVNLRFADEALYAQITGDMNAFLSAYNEACPKEAFYGAYTYVRGDTQHCLMITRGE